MNALKELEATELGTDGGDWHELAAILAAGDRGEKGGGERLKEVIAHLIPRPTIRDLRQYQEAIVEAKTSKDALRVAFLKRSYPQVFWDMEGKPEIPPESGSFDEQNRPVLSVLMLGIERGQSFTASELCQCFDLPPDELSRRGVVSIGTHNGEAVYWGATIHEFASRFYRWKLTSARKRAQDRIVALDLKALEKVEQGEDAAGQGTSIGRTYLEQKIGIDHRLLTADAANHFYRVRQVREAANKIERENAELIKEIAAIDSEMERLGLT